GEEEASREENPFPLEPSSSPLALSLGRKRDRLNSPTPYSLLPSLLEGDDSFENEPVELSTVADVRAGEVVVFLVHVLTLQQDRWCNEPAARDLVPVDAHLIGNAIEGAARRVVARAEVHV